MAADAVRAIVDVHIALPPQFAAQGHYLAVDVLHSVSRLMSQIASLEQKVPLARCGRLFPRTGTRRI